MSPSGPPLIATSRIDTPSHQSAITSSPPIGPPGVGLPPTLPPPPTPPPPPPSSSSVSLHPQYVQSECKQQCVSYSDSVLMSKFQQLFTSVVFFSFLTDNWKNLFYLQKL